MKKIYSIVLSLAFVTSCVGFLDESPTTSLSNVYDNEYALETSVRGIIRGFEGSGMYVGDMLENFQSCSGLVHWGEVSSRLGDERWDCVLRTLNYSSMSLNITMYSSFYSAINRCNILIDALPASPVSESYKKEIDAEARLYRAYLYFTLVRIYSDVPLSLKGISKSTDYVATGRTNYNRVYEQIVRDLDTAFLYMRTPERVAEVTGTQGRPNKWAAKALKAVVYLQMASLLSVPEDENFYDSSKEGRRPDFTAVGINTAEQAWQKAYDCSIDVIENGPYRLAWNYGDLFKWQYGYSDHYGKDCWNLDERILMIQSTGSNVSNYSATRTLPQYPEGTSVASGTGISRHSNIRPDRYLFQKWCELTDGTKGSEGTGQETMYLTSKDPRLDISLYHTQYKRSFDGRSIAVYPSPSSISGTSRDNAMPFYKKYASPTYAGIPDVADLYLLRFSEIYYVAAEAAARLGRIGEACQIIDNVHARARRSTSSGVEAEQPIMDEAEFADADEFVTALIWDKLFEFCGEDHEFFEVRRLGSRWFSEQVIKPINAFLQLPEQVRYRDLYYGENFQYESDPQKLRASLLCEFPKDELTMNPAMTLDDKNDYSWE